MRERRHISTGMEDDFPVMDLTEITKMLTGTTKTLTALLGAVAAVSLLVGGIGIMNIMLVSVTERTREIGMQMLRRILERLELTLNEAKTRIVNACKGKFDFLGFTIWMGQGRKTGNHYPHGQPSKKSMQAIKDRVTKLTTRSRTIMTLDWIVNEVNATVRGWVGYVHYRNCSKTKGHIRNHVKERLITHLRTRHKVRDRKAGYAGFKNRALYDRYGIYKVPTTAVWKRAHAL